MSDRLRQARKAAGFASAADAAERLGIKLSTYAGHENGSRNFRIDSAERYARAFGVDVQWLLYGTEPKDRDDRMGEDFGFADAAVPYQQAKGRRPPERALIDLLAPNASTPVLWVAAESIPDQAILAGDVLVVDQRPPFAAGQLVIANLVDEETTLTRTLIRRYWPPSLAPGTFEPGARVVEVGKDAVNIVGAIVASYRTA